MCVAAGLLIALISSGAYAQGDAAADYPAIARAANIKAD
jgi:hypothetical protein